MLSPKKRTPKVEEVRGYVEGVAKNLVDKLYGPEGPPWGTTLTELEDAWTSTLEPIFPTMAEIEASKMLD